MSLQQERIAELCESLKLGGIAAHWRAEAQDAAKREASFADFLERLLGAANAARDERRVSTLMMLVTMPVVKTLNDFDWKSAADSTSRLDELERQVSRERQQLQAPPARPPRR